MYLLILYCLHHIHKDVTFQRALLLKHLAAVAAAGNAVDGDEDIANY